jgi:hypothetical protein
VPFWRRKPKLEQIDETQAYSRAYGGPRLDVRRVQLPPRRPRNREVLAHGESLRRAFLDRLQRRGDEEEAEMAGADENGEPEA